MDDQDALGTTGDTFAAQVPQTAAGGAQVPSPDMDDPAYAPPSEGASMGAQAGLPVGVRSPESDSPVSDLADVLAAEREEGATDEAAPEQRAEGGAGALANVSRHLREGLTALRDVADAKARHGSAVTQMKRLQDELADVAATLDHRVQIECDFEQIVAVQTAEIEEAGALAADAALRSASFAAERDALSAQLATLKADNEEALRPYKNLMDTTKGRFDDAAVALADARRAVRAGEGQLADATRKRDQRVASANRAVDNAQERLRRVQTELDKLQRDPGASTVAIPKMRDELMAEREHLDATRADVTRVSTEAQEAIEAAQAVLWAQKQALEAAERTAEESKREAAEARAEYERLYKQAKAGEDELAAGIREGEDALGAADAEQASAEARVEVAQATLDEANDIHGTPEVTEELRMRLAEGNEELERRDREVKDLAQSMRELRESTRSKRLALFAAIAAVAILAIALITFFATR